MYHMIPKGLPIHDLNLKSRLDNHGPNHLSRIQPFFLKRWYLNSLTHAIIPNPILV
jgi:hypothetical protein